MRVFIVVSGGIVRDVFSAAPIDFVILDEDTEGRDGDTPDRVTLDGEDFLASKGTASTVPPGWEETIPA